MSLLPQEIGPRILSIVSPVYRNGQFIPQTIRGQTQVNAFLENVTQMQEQLRAVKRDIQLEMQTKSRAYDTARTQADSHPFMALFQGKKRAEHQRAADRTRLRAAEAEGLEQYEHGLLSADWFIRLLDQVKLDAQQQVARQRGQQHRAIQVPPPVTASGMAGTVAPVAASLPPGYGPVNLQSKVWWSLDPRDPFGCCADCRKLAAGSPYVAPGQDGRELPATPGDGYTACGAACTCEVDYVPPHLKQRDAWAPLSAFDQQLRRTPPERRQSLWVDRKVQED